MTLAKALVLFLLTMVLITSVLGQQPGIIKQITIRGNVNITSDFIKLTMKSKEGGSFQLAQLTQDEKAILELGYFQDVKVLSRPLSETEYEVIVDVSENPVIKEIRVTGNTVIPTEQIIKVITQPIGKVLNLRNIRPSLEAITKLYIDKGYYAQAEAPALRESPSTLNIVIIERRVGDIYISGLTRTNEKVVRKLFKTKPGEAFSDEKLGTDIRRLNSTQWFEKVDGQFKETDEIGKLDIHFDVKEARTAQIGVGVALDPRSRLAGSIRYSDSNFRGSGQSVGLSLTQDTAGAGLSVDLSYSNPWMDSKDTAMSMRLFSRVNSYFTGSGFGGVVSPTDDRFDERRTGGSFSFTRPFNKEVSGTVGASYESIRTINLRTTGNNFIQQDGQLALINLQVARDRRDVPLDPASGDFARLIVEPGFSNITKIGGSVASERDILGRNNFLRNTLEYKAFFSKRPPKGKEDQARSVLAFRARYGVITGKVPFFEQFFIGGADSVRGYPEQRFWGKQSFLSSLEYRYPIQKTFSIIGFVDYGGAWGGYRSINEFTQSNSPRLKLGYGLGVAFRTPLGPIRIDFGFNQDRGNRTHFSIGSSF